MASPNMVQRIANVKVTSDRIRRRRKLLRERVAVDIPYPVGHVVRAGRGRDAAVPFLAKLPGYCPCSAVVLDSIMSAWLPDG